MGRNGEYEDVINISNNCSSSNIHASDLFFIGHGSDYWNVSTTYIERKTMDTIKYKSVAVPIETWRDIMLLANQDTRTPGKVIQWLVKQEKIKRNGKSK